MNHTDELEQLLRQARGLRADIKRQTVEQKALDAEIMAMFYAEGETTLRTDDGTWSIQNRTSKRLDKKLLVLRGVDLDIICLLYTSPSPRDRS